MLDRWRKQQLDTAGDFFSHLDRQPEPVQVEKSVAPGDQRRVSNLRMVMSGGAPGMWASNHFEELQHCSGWNFVAAHALALQFAGATVKAYRKRRIKSRRDDELSSDPIDALKARLERLINPRSKALAPEHQAQSPKERLPLDDEHPLVRLMRKPNPDQSGAQFRYQIAQQLALTGGALVWVLRDKHDRYDPRGTPRELYVIPTGLAYPQPPSAQFPNGWFRVLPLASYGLNLDPEGFGPPGAMGNLLANGGPIDKRDVRSIGWPHPLFVGDWLSALSAGALQTDLAEEIDRAIVARFRNEGRPGLVFGWESVEIWGKISAEEKEAFRADVRARNAGTHNTGNDLMLPPGMKADSHDANPREMDFTGSKPIARNDVLAMHQTPPTVAGINEAVSYAGLFASLKQYIALKVQPNLDMTFEELGEELCPAFGPGHSMEAEARSTDDPTLHAQKLDRLETRGLATIDEARAMEGLGPHPDPEYGKLPAGTTWQSWQQVKQQAEQAKQQAEQAKQQQQAAAGGGGDGGNPLAGLLGGGGDDGGDGGGDKTDGWASLPTDTTTGMRQEFRDAPEGRSDAIGKSAQFDEGKHKRGQPGNAGQFGSGGGSAAADKPAAAGGSQLSKIPAEHRESVKQKLQAALANPNHPDSKATLGRLKTLAAQSGVDADALIKEIGGGQGSSTGIKPPVNQAEILKQIGKRSYNNELHDAMGGGKYIDIKGKIPPQVGNQFDAHGTGTLQTLTDLLNGGVDHSRNFWSASLDSVNHTAGMAGWSVKENSPFIVLGHPGKTIKDGGIAGVIVNGHHADSIPELHQAFPGVKFITDKDAPKLLAQVAGTGGKPVDYGSKSTEDAPYIETKSIFEPLEKSHLDDKHRRASDLWLLLQGRSEAAIIAAAQKFLNDYTEDLRKRLKALIDSGKLITRPDVEALIDRDKIAKDYSALVLLLFIQSAVDGARFEWNQHAPAGANFDHVAKLVEADVRRKWPLQFFVLAANNVHKHLLGESMAAIEAAQAKRAGTAVGVGALVLTAPSSNTLGVTEATATTGLGQDIARGALRMIGIEVLKVWVSMRDDHVRPTHREAHGQVVPADGKFTVGGHKADYPCDPTLPMQERAGCRCHALSFRSDQHVPVSKSITPEEIKATVALAMKEWQESQHPRAQDGKFGSGSSHAAAGSSHEAANPSHDAGASPHDATIDAWAAHEHNDGVTAKAKAKAVTALKDAVARLPGPIADKAMSNMNAPAKFYNSMQELTYASDQRAKQYGEKLSQPGHLIAGIFELNTETGKGQLHLDHDYQGEHEYAVGTHAHELGHAADGKDELSGTPEWQHAFDSEIDHPHDWSTMSDADKHELKLDYEHALKFSPKLDWNDFLDSTGRLSSYARTHPAEGLAEYVRLLVQEPERAKTDFPRCYAFFQKAGLIDAGGQKEKSADIYPRR